MILTDDRSRPIIPPQRDAFPAGLEGSIAFVRAVHAYNDRVAAVANEAFAKAFQKAPR
jgi:hypothetical protein